MELESKRLDMERDRMKYEHELRQKQMEIELARINVVEHLQNLNFICPLGLLSYSLEFR
jgi:hypothetical protein